MNLYYINHGYRYEAEKLLRLFFPLEKINEYTEFKETKEDYLLTRIDGDGVLTLTAELSLRGDVRRCVKTVKKDGCEDLELELLLCAYGLLCEMCGFTPKWGILTGVRPIKLMRRLIGSLGEDGAREYFKNKLMVSNEKTELAVTTQRNENKILELSGIPCDHGYVYDMMSSDN